MSRPAVLRVFAYDISDDRRRSRIAEVLEEHAVRVQLSVFEARMTQGELTRVMHRLAEHLEPEDKLRVYTIPADALAGCRVHGGPPLPEAQDFWLL